MIYYETTCRYCRQTFRLVEGTAKYARYKKNRDEKFSCDDCDRRIEADSRKYLFDREWLKKAYSDRHCRLFLILVINR